MNNKKKSQLIGTVWERRVSNQESPIIIKIIEITSSGRLKIYCWWKRERYDRGDKRDSMYFDCVAAFYQRTRREIRKIKYTFLHRAPL